MKILKNKNFKITCLKIQFFIKNKAKKLRIGKFLKKLKFTCVKIKIFRKFFLLKIITLKKRGSFYLYDRRHSILGNIYTFILNGRIPLNVINRLKFLILSEK